MAVVSLISVDNILQIHSSVPDGYLKISESLTKKDFRHSIEEAVTGSFSK